jgi:hypothetical protein
MLSDGFWWILKLQSKHLGTILIIIWTLLNGFKGNKN